MKRGELLVGSLAVTTCLLLVSDLTPGLDAPEPMHASPNIPGITVVGEVKQVCPRNPPIRVNLNNDGADDFLSPSYHVGDLTHYTSPEAAAAIGGLIGLAATEGSKGVFRHNKNFTNAGLLDGSTTRLIWSLETSGLIEHHSLSSTKSRIYLASHDDNIYAVDVASGDTLWKTDVGGTILGFAASDAEIVVVTAKDGVHAYSTDDGSVQWHHSLRASVATGEFGVFRADEEQVYVASTDNNIYAFHRRSGDREWTFKTHGDAHLMLLSGDTLVIADGKELLGIDTRSGASRWVFNTKNSLVHTAQMLDLDGKMGFVHLGRRARHPELVVLNITDGTVAWQLDLDKLSSDKKRKIHVPEDRLPLKTNLVVIHGSDGAVEFLVGADSKKLMKVRFSDGTVEWSSPAKHAQLVRVVGDRVVTVDAKKKIQSLEFATGKSVWEEDAPAHVHQMEELGGMLFLTLYSKELVVLSMADGASQGQFQLGEPYRLVPSGEDRLLVCGEEATWVLEASPSDTTGPGDEPSAHNGGYR